MVFGREPSTRYLEKGLRALNMRRDRLIRQFPGSLLWCGTPEFIAACWGAMPDMWSIRALSFRLEAAPPPKEGTAPPPPFLALRLLARAWFGHPGLRGASDGDAAVAAAERLTHEWEALPQNVQLPDLGDVLIQHVGLEFSNALVSTGRLEDADQVITELERRLLSDGSGWPLQRTRLQRARIALKLGRLQEASRALQSAREGEAEDGWLKGDFVELEAALNAASGAWQAGESGFREMAKDSSMPMRQRGAILCALGEILARQGRFPESTASFNEGIGAYRSGDDREGEVLAFILQGDLEFERNHWQRVERFFQRARTLARELGDDEVKAAVEARLEQLASQVPSDAHAPGLSLAAVQPRGGEVHREGVAKGGIGPPPSADADTSPRPQGEVKPLIFASPVRDGGGGRGGGVFGGDGVGGGGKAGREEEVFRGGGRGLRAVTVIEPSGVAPPLVEMPLSPAERKALRKILVGLYPERSRAQLMAQDAGLEFLRADASRTLEQFWYDLLQEAERAGPSIMERLVALALEDHPTHPELRRWLLRKKRAALAPLSERLPEGDVEP